MIRRRTHVGSVRVLKICLYNSQSNSLLFTIPYDVHGQRFNAVYPTTIGQFLTNKEFTDLVNYCNQKMFKEVIEPTQKQQKKLYFFFVLFFCVFFLPLFFIGILVFMVTILTVQSKCAELYSDGCKSLEKYMEEINKQTFNARGCHFKIEYDNQTTINGRTIGNDNVTNANLQNQLAQQNLLIQQQQQQLAQNQAFLQQQQMGQQPMMNAQQPVAMNVQQPVMNNFPNTQVAYNQNPYNNTNKM